MNFSDLRSGNQEKNNPSFGRRRMHSSEYGLIVQSADLIVRYPQFPLNAQKKRAIVRSPLSSCNVKDYKMPIKRSYRQEEKLYQPYNRAAFNAGRK